MKSSTVSKDAVNLIKQTIKIPKSQHYFLEGEVGEVVWFSFGFLRGVGADVIWVLFLKSTLN